MFPIARMDSDPSCYFTPKNKGSHGLWGSRFLQKKMKEREEVRTWERSENGKKESKRDF